MFRLGLSLILESNPLGSVGLLILMTSDFEGYFPLTFSLERLSTKCLMLLEISSLSFGGRLGSLAFSYCGLLGDYYLDFG